MRIKTPTNVFVPLRNAVTIGTKTRLSLKSGLCSLVVFGITASCPLPVADAAPPAYRFLPLGRIGGWNARALLILEHSEPNHPNGPCTVRVCYQLQSGTKRLRTDVQEACESYLPDLRTVVGRFTGGGHKQLFVSATMGRVCTHLYDLSGTRLRTLYSREEGRVVVSPKRNASGGYDLEERWPKRQWEDEENLGDGRYDRRTNYVRRLLHWNGKAFVPYHPGPSRIVK